MKEKDAHIKDYFYGIIERDGEGERDREREREKIKMDDQNALHLFLCLNEVFYLMLPLRLQRERYR